MLFIMKLLSNIIALFFLFIVVSANEVNSKISISDIPKKHIRVKGGNDAPPFEYINEKGDFVGFNVDLIDALFQELGYTYEIELAPWHQVREEIENRDIDMVTWMYVDSIRKSVVDIGVPYGEVFIGIFSNKKDEIKSVSELKHKIVAVHRGDIMHEYILKYRWSDNIIIVEHPLESLKLVDVGRANVALMSCFQGLYYMNEEGLENIIYNKADLESFKYSFGVKKGDSELAQQLAAALYQLKIQGTYDYIYDKWFSVYKEIGNNKKELNILKGLLLLLVVAFVLYYFLNAKKTVSEKEKIENYLQSIFSITSMGVCIIIDNKIRYANNALRNITKQILKEGEKNDVDNIFFSFDEYKLFLSEVETQLLLADIAVTEVVLKSNDKKVYCLASVSKYENRGFLMTFTDISQQREAAINLKVADQKLNMHLENSPLGYVEFDGNFVVKSWSQKSEELFGWSNEEVIDKNIMDLGLIAGSGVDVFLDKIAELKNNNIRNTIVSCRNIKKNGDFIETIWYLSFASYNGGNVSSVLCMVHDVSELEAAQSRIVEEQERSNLIIDAAKIGTWEWDDEMGIATVNKYYANLLGYTVEEFKMFSKKKLAELVHPEDRQMLVAKIKSSVLNDDEKIEITIRMQHKFGYYLTFIKRGSSYINSRKNRKVVAGILADISEEKEKQSFIKKLSVAIDHSPASIVITDKIGNIEYVNYKFIDQTGYSKNEIVGKKMRVFRKGHISDFDYAEMFENIESGKVWAGEHLNRKKNKESYWEMVQISPILDEKGFVQNYVVVSEDITERKVIQRELINAKERAEESDQLKSLFLNNLSHEVRTPLNSITGFSEILHHEMQNDESLNFYSFEILKSSRHLLSMMDNIINLSLIETGKILIRKSYVNINDLISDVKNQLLFLFYNQKTIFTTEIIPSDLDTIFVDYQKVQNILINLINNAIKFSHKGEIKLICEKIDNNIHFTISDQGVGIPDDIKNYVFNKFYQGDNSISGLNEGLGIGLSLVKSYIDLMEGEISFESSPEGTTFNLSLPCKTIKDEESFAYLAQSVKQKILIVDNVVGDYEIVTEILSHYQYEFLYAKNDKEAYEIIKTNNDISLLIIDVYMPRKVGIETIKLVREIYPNLPIVIYTSHSISKIKAQLDEFGYEAFLPKPINRRTLLSIVNRVLANSKIHKN